MKRILLLSTVMIYVSLEAQDVTKTVGGINAMPNAVSLQWELAPEDIGVSFVSDNERFTEATVPAVKLSEKTLTAWKGERVHTQIAVWSKKKIESIAVKRPDLMLKNGGRIPKTNIQAGFVRFVMTDEFKNGCGYRKPQDFDSSLIADPIDTSTAILSSAPGTTQPVWITVDIPADAAIGKYTGVIQVNTDKTITELSLTVNVINRILPPPSQWKFNLDLWQHPAAIARIHKVDLWSDTHFAFMRKYYAALARAGQKNITVSVVNEPWGHQTYDDYPGMIKWTKKKDGTWEYDYSLFDKYISFVMSCGINKRINCYSMVPWKIAFQYYDESFGRDTVFKGAIGSPAYNAFWKPMLADFTQHLKSKGWFDITAIAMDERPLPAMQAVIALLKEVDKGWKVALAGNYHPEIEKDIFDYCVASRWQFPTDVLQTRQQQGKLSTWYTCCTENYPNGFTFSPPAEHVWLGWYTAAKNMDGYLRWAFNSWPANPMQDSRFTAWPAGDTYQIYPGPFTSIRFEKLIEGIQDFEKINILRDEYKTNSQAQKLKELEAILNTFEIGSLKHKTAEQMVARAKSILNQ